MNLSKIFIQPTIHYLFLFLFVGIIFVLWYDHMKITIFMDYMNKSDTPECECCGNKEGFASIDLSQGSVRGSISRRMHPIRRKIEAGFKNPSAEYYYNKLTQIFR
jgi:hypothetical protein